MTVSQTLVIPDLDPTQYALNEMRAMHPQKWNRAKKHMQEYIGWLAKQAKLIPFTGPVWMDYLWVMQNGRRDKSNIAAGGRKVIEDALCPRHWKNNPMGVGILRGDKWRDIIGFSDRFDIDKLNPRIVVTMTEVE